jgi:hypothetical protein
MTKEELCDGLRTILHHVNELFDKVPKMTDAEYAAFQAYMREIDALVEGFKPLIQQKKPPHPPPLVPFKP